MAPVRKDGQAARSAKLKRAAGASAFYPTKDTYFPSTKEDKRRIKHSNLISRIEKSQAKPAKRRRPSKKLITTLESLADALPDMEDVPRIRTTDNAIKIKHQSLKSRRGAMKKREQIERLERERFSKNLAQMTERTVARTGDSQDANEIGSDLSNRAIADNAGVKISDRWAALRGFIQSTMDRIP